MESLVTLVLVLMPMFIGFAIPSNPTMTKVADKGLSYLVFIILALIAVAGTVAGIYSIARDDYPQRFDTHFQDFTLRSEK